MHAHNDGDIEFTALLVAFDFEFVQGTICFLSSQCVCKLGSERAQCLFIIQVTGRQCFGVNQFVPQARWHYAMHARNHLLNALVLIYQTFQCNAFYSWSTFRCVQFSAIYRYGRQVISKRIIVFQILLLFTLFHFIQRWLSDINITTFDNLRHLTIEER